VAAQALEVLFVEFGRRQRKRNKTAEEYSRKGARAQRKTLILLSSRLCAFAGKTPSIKDAALLPLLLRRFRQIVQNQSVRVREVFFHHALNVGGGDSLQPIEISIHASGISQQDRRLSQCECLAVACFALALLARDDLVLGLFQFRR
jgi:hypothetical protein